MDFEWNNAKAATNLRKHGIDFAGATRVFRDPWRIEMLDRRETHGEDRWKTVGQIDGVLIAVIYTVRDKVSELSRIIFARKADTNERETYREILH